MSKYILETLFESRPRLKILKFLFRNANSSFSVKELAAHVQEKPLTVKKEIAKLREIGLVKLKR